MLCELEMNNKMIFIFKDNGNAIFSNNGDNNRRCKHIDVRYKFLNDEMEEGNVEIKYIEFRK